MLYQRAMQQHAARGLALKTLQALLVSYRPLARNYNRMLSALSSPAFAIAELDKSTACSATHTMHSATRKIRDREVPGRKEAAQDERRCTAAPL